MSLGVLHRSPTAPHGRRSRAAALGVSLLALGALLVPASVAAHNPSASLECVNDSPWLAIGITNYNSNVTNTVSASIDGTSVLGTTTFGSSYSNGFSAGSPFDAHTAEVIIKAGDDPTGSKGWTITFDMSVDPCQQPTPSPTPAPTPTPTDSPTPIPTETAPPTGSALPSESASASPSGSAGASSGTQVTPPATSTGGPGGGSSNGALLLALALMGLTTTGILVLVPNPVNRRRR